MTVQKPRHFCYVIQGSTISCQTQNEKDDVELLTAFVLGCLIVGIVAGIYCGIQIIRNWPSDDEFDRWDD